MWATLNFLGNQFWDLTSAPLTKLQYLFSRSISGIFVQAAHKNYCTRGACSKNAIKIKNKVIEVSYGSIITCRRARRLYLLTT